MNINPFVFLFANIISLYTTSFIIWIICSWLIKLNVINGYQPFVQKIMRFFHQIFEPPLEYLRKFIPLIAGIDITPIILILLLNFVKEALFTYFLKM